MRACLCLSETQGRERERGDERKVEAKTGQKGEGGALEGGNGRGLGERECMEA